MLVHLLFAVQALTPQGGPGERPVAPNVSVAGVYNGRNGQLQAQIPRLDATVTIDGNLEIGRAHV